MPSLGGSGSYGGDDPSGGASRSNGGYGHGGDNDISVSYGQQGLWDVISGLWGGLDFTSPSMSSYYDVFGSVSNGSAGRNRPYNPFNQLAQEEPAPWVNPMAEQARADMNGGWGNYQRPQMNPVQYGGQQSYGATQPFRFSDYFGGGK
jgi:hypothetical protein